MKRYKLQTAQARTLAIILGGGAGSRLFPLTMDRSKPAVPLGGKYRLVDIPISNCLNYGFTQIYVLTQFNSVSLHRHINSAYRFDSFGNNFVEILAAQQTREDNGWYQGTADAVRQNLRYFLRPTYDYYLVLSGDQLYRMDYRRLLSDHLDAKADLTIATLPVEREPAKGFGIMQTSDSGCITRFVEKPRQESLLNELKMSAEMLNACGLPTDSERYLASMGIYLFNRKTLVQCLDNDMVDFGRDVIPGVINESKVLSHIFQGYWKDIGTIDAFFRANLDMAKIVPAYDFFYPNAQIYTNPHYLPASKINSATIKESIVADGCILTDVYLENSVIGVRSIIGNETRLTQTVVMGADQYLVQWARENPGSPPFGIGRGCRINRAIIDKNAHIGDGVIIDPQGKPSHFDGDNYYIRDGIVVVPKNAVIPSGTII
ncbi:MAG: glucose-1-phosphate adenylyltransferase [Lysobacterales bacterium]